MTFKKFTPALIASAALVAAAAFAAPAGASGSYSPSLRASGDNAKFAAATYAPYGVTVCVKSTSPVATSGSPVTTSGYRTYVRASLGTRSVAAVAPTGSTTELAQAQTILAGLIAKYPILAGTTVTFGDARGYQAIAYYGSGRIVISTTHTATLDRILNHEVWHIIDYRDNGIINWGENVPPRS